MRKDEVFRTRGQALSTRNTSMIVYSKLCYIIVGYNYSESDYVDICWGSLTKRHECEKVFFLVASSHGPFSFPSNCSLMDKQDFQI